MKKSHPAKEQYQCLKDGKDKKQNGGRAPRKGQKIAFFFHPKKDHEKKHNLNKFV